ncbi:MAG: hypothetical protein EBX40_00280 [Gammaproteobacteria bacterium]|nr:hypothetical protein [Gammaproteobacteria bacterium]
MNRKRAKHRCVFLYKLNGKPYRWVVRFTVNKERRYIGCFKDHGEACQAAEQAAKRLGYKYEGNQFELIHDAPTV